MAAVVVLMLVACGGNDPVAVPDGVTFRLEQARQDLQGRNIEFQVVNGGSRDIAVTRAEFTSPRFRGLTSYRGPAVIPAGETTNLTFEMPRAQCGTRIGVTATVHYRIGGGQPRTSVIRPADHYGSVALAMARDCAESTIGKLSIDRELSVTGSGKDSVLNIGMTFAPAPAGGRVVLGPLDGTTLLKPAVGSGIDHVLKADGSAYSTVVRIIPNRCDVHVVAEDRTGAIMPLHVDSKVSGRSFFFVRFSEHQKNQIFDFVASHCGFGTTKDPLNAP